MRQVIVAWRASSAVLAVFWCNVRWRWAEYKDRRANPDVFVTLNRTDKL